MTTLSDPSHHHPDPVADSEHPARENPVQDYGTRDGEYLTADTEDLTLFLELDAGCRHGVGKSGDRHQRARTAPLHDGRVHVKPCQDHRQQD